MHTQDPFWTFADAHVSRRSRVLGKRSTEGRDSTTRPTQSLIVGLQPMTLMALRGRETSHRKPHRVTEIEFSLELWTLALGPLNPKEPQRGPSVKISCDL